MIEYGTFKDRPAILAKTSRFTAVFLPEDGARLASVRDADGFEYLCQDPAKTFRRLPYDGEYTEAEVAGCDDMFPTIDPCKPSVGCYRDVTYPDHGEVCRLPAEVTVGTDGKSVVFNTVSRLFDVGYQKTVTVDGAELCFDYRIENRTAEPFPYLWAAHLMLRGTDDFRLETGYPAGTPVEYVSNGDRAPLPEDRLFPEGACDFTYKLYYKPPIRNGFVRGRYEESGKSITFDFGESVDKLPYIGLWVNNGHFKGLRNMAPEFCTAPFDSPANAEQRGLDSTLAPHETVHLKWRIRTEDKK